MDSAINNHSSAHNNCEPIDEETLLIELCRQEDQSWVAGITYLGIFVTEITISKHADYNTACYEALKRLINDWSEKINEILSPRNSYKEDPIEFQNIIVRRINK